MKSVALGLVLFSMLLFGCTQQQAATATLESTIGDTPTPTPLGSSYNGNYPRPTGSGRVVAAITDAAADMGSVSSVKVTIDEVQVQSATQGWVTLSSTPKTFDLLELKAKGKAELLADANLTEGSYSQMRLVISKVVVADGNGTHEAKMPSGELKLNADLVVDADSTSTATFDFIADESLHMTGKGEYILAPVLHIETREQAQAEVEFDGRVRIMGGRVVSDEKVGMDAKGNIGVNLSIPADLELSIEGGFIKVGAKSGLVLGDGTGISGSDAWRGTLGVGSSAIVGGSA